MPKAALLLVILAVSASKQLVLSSPTSAIDAPTIQHSTSSTTSRWLTYACNSKTDNVGGGSRRLLDRILTHPCSSHSRSSTSTTSLYNSNTNKSSSGLATALQITLGIIAGILTLLGMLYVIDKETFTLLTGMKYLPFCNCRSGCAKPRIDADEENIDEQTPYERDQYLTKETAAYLEEKHDREVLQPKRRLKTMLWCCFRAKEYGDGDKYHIPWTGSEDEAEPRVNMCLVFWEELRLRLFWKPTKVYNDDRDKYAVEGNPSGITNGEGEIKYAASSYESADVGTTPW